MRDPILPMIDVDVHPTDQADRPVADYLPAAFREALAMGLGGSPGTGYANPFGTVRRDVKADSPAAIIEEHLDRYDLAWAVLQPQPGMYVSTMHNLDLGTAMARAWNQWLEEVYLPADARFLGSICVNMSEPARAAEEIRRAGRNSRMVQVLTCGESIHLYGHRFYWPVYEACAEMGRPLAIHPGNEGSLHSATPVGRPANYFQWHTLLPLTYQAHLVSMVAEGVFEAFGAMKVILVEGGIAWLAHTMWRMDKNFKALRSTAPWLKRRPSEYMIEHFRLTTQPLEEPDDPHDLLEILRLVRAEKTVLFSTDFPHWDFDDPRRAFPARMDPQLKRRIFYDNAAELYGLPSLEDRRDEMMRQREGAGQ